MVASMANKMILLMLISEMNSLKTRVNPDINIEQEDNQNNHLDEVAR